MIAICMNVAAVLLGGALFAPAPPSVTAKNDVERMVLDSAESASRELEDWLDQRRDDADRYRELVEAGFRRIRPGDACANYVYTRQLTNTVVRGASVILCNGKRPFVLRTDETPGRWTAPRPDQPAVTVPTLPE